MLFNADTNVFNFSVDNFGSTFTDTGLGVNAPGHASANTKGANTNLMNGLAQDCFALGIMFVGGSTSAGIRRQLTDILIDPNAGVGNAGSSWSVLIANLYSNSPSWGIDGSFGYSYYFPIYLAAGTAIGAAHQDSTATTQALRVCVRAFGKPTRPELIRVGRKVTTYGANTTSTSGSPHTPGTAVVPSYDSIVNLTADAWWWQLGIGSGDTTMVPNNYMFDLAIGDSTNKRIAIQGLPYVVVGAAERISKGAVGGDAPVLVGKTGETIYVRATGAIAPDTQISCIAYGLGG